MQLNFCCAVDDLRANTEYTGNIFDLPCFAARGFVNLVFSGYTRDSPQIQWFWTVVQV